MNNLEALRHIKNLLHEKAKNQCDEIRFYINTGTNKKIKIGIICQDETVLNLEVNNYIQAYYYILGYDTGYSHGSYETYCEYEHLLVEDDEYEDEED